MKHFTRFNGVNSFGHLISPADRAGIPDGDESLFIGKTPRLEGVKPEAKFVPLTDAQRNELRKIATIRNTLANIDSITNTIAVANFIEFDAAARGISPSNKTRESKLLNPLIGINDIVSTIVERILGGDEVLIKLFTAHLGGIDFMVQNRQNQPERRELEE